MILDELISRLESISSDLAIAQLSGLLSEWKSDESTVAELRRDVERFIGNPWVQKDEDHERIYALWSEFRDREIDGIGGMTMNERLFSFGLFDRFEACTDQKARLVIYRKLLASP